MKQKSYNFFEVTKVLEATSLSHPFVNNVYFNRYRLNDTNDIMYPAVVFLHQSTDVSDSSTLITWNIIYVDRLTKDRSNLIEIQSVGKQVITEILNTLVKSGNFYLEEDSNGHFHITFNIFDEQYADHTAGVIANVNISHNSDLGYCTFIDYDDCAKCK